MPTRKEPTISLSTSSVSEKIYKGKSDETGEVMVEPTGIEFSGSAREYFGIWIVNLILTIITLGIYSAWAKVRRQIY